MRIFKKIIILFLFFSCKSLFLNLFFFFVCNLLIVKLYILIYLLSTCHDREIDQGLKELWSISNKEVRSLKSDSGNTPYVFGKFQSHFHIVLVVDQPTLKEMGIYHHRLFFLLVFNPYAARTEYIRFQASFNSNKIPLKFI